MLTTTFVVEVRCSTLLTCADTTSQVVFVNCPSSGNLGFPRVVAPNETTLTWGSSLVHDWAKGGLAVLRGGSYATTGQLAGVGPASSYDTSADLPLEGGGLWYLFRESGPLGSGATIYCNAPGISWGNPARDTALP
jgi:hypothetical protein